MIELSVALPMFKTKYIGWLPLESLVRQRNINFDWELIIAEEQNDETFGEENIKEYKERLNKVRCRKVVYIPLEKHIYLPSKYKLIVNNCSVTSKVFVIQSADCYSQPMRLRQTYDIIVKENYDWTRSDIGLFYNIGTGRIALYDKRGRGYRCGLNMAAKIDFVRGISPVNLRRGVDSWLVDQLVKVKGGLLNIKPNNSEYWKYGIDTQGLNTISIRRPFKMADPTKFKESPYKIEEVLPIEIVERLLSCKIYCRKGFT